MKYQKFLLFGDSIIEFAYESRLYGPPDGYTLGGALTTAYTRRMDIIQRGFIGYSSRWGLQILPHVLANEKGIVMALVGFGSNDVCLGGNVRVPIEEYVENMRQMVHMLQQNGIKPIVAGPAVIDEPTWENIRGEEEIKQGYRRKMEDFQRYDAALQKMAAEEKIPMVNLHDHFSKIPQWKNYLCDGLHFNGAGSLQYAQLLLKTIAEHYPELSPESIPYKLPQWDQVQPNGSNLF